MSRWTIAVLGVALCAALPAGAQQPERPRPGGHAHGSHGHNDMADVRAALRLVAVYQARHHAQHGRYAASLQELGLPQPDEITVRITADAGRGFSAVSASSAEECVYWEGHIARPRDFAGPAGQLTCRARR